MEEGENTSAKWYFYLFRSCVLAIFKTKLLSLGQGIVEVCIFRGQDNAGFQNHIKWYHFMRENENLSVENSFFYVIFEPYFKQNKALVHNRRWKA